MRHVHPVDDLPDRIMAIPLETEVWLVALLRVREWADYAESPSLAPAEPISGQAALDLYLDFARDRASDVGGEMVVSGATHPTVIGPSEESWDWLMVIRYPDRFALLGAVATPDNVEMGQHRTAALHDSRVMLVPGGPEVPAREGLVGSILPTEHQLADLVGLPDGGPVVMCNLLGLRAVADYSPSPGLAPASPSTGAEAFAAYARGALPEVARVGGHVLHAGGPASTIVGPADLRWDRVLLVRYPSIGAFREMLASPGYAKIAGHRTAAVLDSRLVPARAEDDPGQQHTVS